MYRHWRQSGVNSAGARRGFSGILLQNTYIYTNLKQIPGDDRKYGGASAPPAPPSLAPMCIEFRGRAEKVALHMLQWQHLVWRHCI